MAKRKESVEKLVFPPGVRDITEDISTDDLVRRLKDCALAFQNMSQDEDNSTYIPLALHLASEVFIEHNSKDVQLLTACCIADVFRVYAPDAPYKDPQMLKVIFEFFVDQLEGLKDTEDPSFKRYFYLLENFTWVKTFNLCAELEDNQRIFCRLFKLMFSIISDNHSEKVKKFMIDMLSPLITEADVVSTDLLELLLAQIIEPNKSKNKNAHVLAQEILKKTSATLEPYVQNFFNNALVLGKTTQSKLSTSVYDLIHELNIICPSMLVAVLPQLEFKLKSSEEKERVDVTKVLAKMFSNKNSQLASQNPPLWRSFMGRFNDISGSVRMLCVQCSIDFLLNQPDLRVDITEQLKQRQHDVEENVRFEVVATIIATAKKDITCVNEDLLHFVKERTLDKKFKIRKEALLGLATIYKKHVNHPGDAPLSTPENLSWIMNKVLHVYYQTSLEDRLLVERILHTCLVPYQNPVDERMKKLYYLCATVDDYALRALFELIKCQSVVRKQFKNLVEVVQCDGSENRNQTICTKISLLTKHLQDPVKAHEHILKFCNTLETNLSLRNMVLGLLRGNVTCSDAEQYVKRILKALNTSPQSNAYYVTIKQLLERVAPVMIDKDAIKCLVNIIKDSLLESAGIGSELGAVDAVHRGLQILDNLATAFPVAFQQEEIYNDLLLFLQADDEFAIVETLQVLIKITADVERKFPLIATKLIPLLENFAETGTKKQAKLSIYCLNGLVSDKETIFGLLMENLKKHFTLESQYFRTALISVGHIAFLCHGMFVSQLKTIVSKVVVKDLLMLDQDLPRGGEENWAPLESIPEETKVKIEGMKLMVRYLMGLKNAVKAAESTIRLLETVITHGGDLMERQHTAPFENSWLRYTAANCMLKLCYEKKYMQALTMSQFQVLASVINDPVMEVQERFAKKLHKGLCQLNLPLKFMSIFSLAGIEENKEFKKLIKNYLISCIKKRREYLKQQPATTQSLLSNYLPDYAMPYTIHLLAHAPFLKAYNDVPSLQKVKDCLWLFMEPLVQKNEHYSFAFFKRLIENIKQTKDKQCIDDTGAQLKMYAVCDLALSIVISKSEVTLKEAPAEPLLPKDLFTDVDKSFKNMKTYLPAELVGPPPKNFVYEVDLFSGPVEAAAPSNQLPSSNPDKSPEPSELPKDPVPSINSADEADIVNNEEHNVSESLTSEAETSVASRRAIRPKRLSKSTKKNHAVSESNDLSSAKKTKDFAKNDEKKNLKKGKTKPKEKPVVSDSNEDTNSIAQISERLSTNSPNSSLTDSPVVARAPVYTKKSKFTKIRSPKSSFQDSSPVVVANQSMSVQNLSSTILKRAKLKSINVKNKKKTSGKTGSVNLIMQKRKVRNLVRECNVSLTRENFLPYVDKLSVNTVLNAEVDINKSNEISEKVNSFHSDSSKTSKLKRKRSIENIDPLTSDISAYPKDILVSSAENSVSSDNGKNKRIKTQKGQIVVTKRKRQNNAESVTAESSQTSSDNAVPVKKRKTNRKVEEAVTSEENEKSAITKKNEKSSVSKKNEKSPTKKNEKYPSKKSEKSPIKKNEKSPIKKNEKSPIKKNEKSPLKKNEMSPVSKKNVKVPATKKNEKAPVSKKNEKAPVSKKKEKPPVSKKNEKPALSKKNDKKSASKKSEKTEESKQNENNSALTESEKIPLEVKNKKSVSEGKSEKVPAETKNKKAPASKSKSTRSSSSSSDKKQKTSKSTSSSSDRSPSKPASKAEAQKASKQTTTKKTQSSKSSSQESKASASEKKKSDSSTSSSPVKTRKMQSTISKSNIANGTRSKNLKKKDVTPSKKKPVAAALLAKAISSSKKKASTSSKVKQTTKRR